MKLPLAILLLLVVFDVKLAGQQSTALQLHGQNPHYLSYRSKPIILVGSGEHYGSVINLDFDFEKYLQSIAMDGLNTTRLFTGAYIEKTGDFGIQHNVLAPGEGRLVLPWPRSAIAGYALGGNKFDLDKWDETYFSRLKKFMSSANTNGIIVEINLFSAHYAGGWNYSALNRKNNVNQTDSVAAKLVNTLENGNILKRQELYVRKIVRELNAFDNLYYELQNEPWADQSDTVLTRNEYSNADEWRSTIQVVSQRSNDWQRQVARWIKSEESSLPNKHLISQNISNFHYPITDADPNVSIFNFHYTLPQAVQENDHLGRVIGFNETGFAGSSDITYRRQAWRFLMAGGGLFNQLDYSFSVGSENGQDTTYKAPGGGSPSLRKQLGWLKHFFDRLDFVQLRPDRTFIVSAPGAMTAVLGNGRSQWVVYYEPMALKPYDITVNLPPGNYRAEWTDVKSGQLLQTATVTRGKVTVPGSATDKVLVINKIDKN